MPTSKTRDAKLMDADRVEDLKDPESWAQDNLIYDDPQHKDFVLSSLNTLRRTRHFCDVVLQVGHADLHAHRAVLASQSRFFYELFSESEESEQKSLPFHYKLGDSFDLEAFESLVNYAYTSRLEISVDKVKAVYKTALVLKMKAPMAICTKYLVDRLSVENCLGIRQFANSLYDESLSSEADNFIRDHVLRIIEASREFRSLPKIKVEVVSTNEQDSRSFKEGHVSSLVLDWLKRHIQVNHDRLEEAVENDVNLLYLHSDNTLHDCIECNDNDDSAALNNSEIIQDYKKTSNKRTMVRNELSSNNLVAMSGGSGKSHSGSDESLNSGAENFKPVDFTMDYSPKELIEDMEPNEKTVNNDNNNGEGAKMNNGAGGSKHPSDGEEHDHNPKVPLKLKKMNPKKNLKKIKILSHSRAGMEGRRRYENVGEIAVCDSDFGPMRFGGSFYQDAPRSSTQLVGGAVVGGHLEYFGLVHQRPGFIRRRFGPALDQFDRTDDARGFGKSLGNLVGRGTQLSGHGPSGDGACPVWDGGRRRRQQADRVRGLRAGRMPRLRRTVRPRRLRLEASPRYADSESPVRLHCLGRKSLRCRWQRRIN